MPHAFPFCTSCGSPLGPVPAGSEPHAARCARCGHAFSDQDPASSPSGTDEVNLVGEVIGECTILARLGAGSFGTVYRAQDETLHRPVALKVFPPTLSADAAAVQKFIRQAVTAAQMHHPGIVAVHRIGKDERRALHYVVMELVEGRSLADTVERKGALPLEEAVPLMIQACEALAAAHESNLVHRDLTPHNLLLDPAGHLKIADFGLSRSHSAEVKADEAWGNPRYMSPEQFDGKAADPRSDIYSLGICFYYMLSKALPFEGQSTAQIIHAKLTTVPRPLWGVSSVVPRSLWLVVERMIARHREDRFSSMREVIARLRPLSSVRPPGAHVPHETVQDIRSELAALRESSTSDHAAAPSISPETMPAPCEDPSGFIFVSYKRGDEPRIAWMLRRMEELELPVWYDQGITPGGDWFAEILDHIENARAYVVFLTRDSVQSRHIDNEVKHAYQCGTPIFPVRLDAVELPKGLRFVLDNVQWIDASLDRERTRTQLDRALRALTRPKP